MDELFRYVYVDHARLDSLYEQIRSSVDLVRPGKVTEKTSFSLRGPSYEYASESAAVAAEGKIQALKIALKRVNRVEHRRPPRITRHLVDASPAFILERMVATKVILDGRFVRGVPAVREFAVWVSEPDPADFTQEPWDFSGTFLYLTEVVFEVGPFHTTYSGCSALQAIVNSATGQPFLERNFAEPNGRRDSVHPVDKLRRLGASVSDLRTIESLYIPRYMTNEQCYVQSGVQRRVHDLLAYPVYIAEF